MGMALAITSHRRIILVALTEALQQALDEAGHTAVDAATICLARVYAEAIDDEVGDLDKLGARLLDCLEALHLTPRARAKVTKGGDDGGQPTNPVDELRQRRARRISGDT